MKKILSIFLLATLIVTCLLSLPFATQAVVTAEFDENILFSAPTKETNATYSNFWLALDDNCASGITAKITNNGGGTIRNINFNAPASIPNGFSTLQVLTKPILAYNNVTTTAVKDFEWDFVEAGNGDTNSKGVYGYFFHINSKSQYTKILQYDGKSGSTAGLSDIHDCFAIIYSEQGTTDGLKAKAYTVLEPAYDENGNSLGLRPIKYTENAETGAIIPDESAYLLNSGTSKFNSMFRKISISLKGDTLALKVEQTEAATGATNIDSNEATFEKTFELSTEALNKVSSGDFVISANYNAVSKPIVYLGNMNIAKLTVNEDYTKTKPLFDSSKITDDTAWLGSNVSDKNITYSNGVATIPASSITTPILKENGFTDTNLTDFVWEFEFKTKNNVAQPSFYFHINESRTTNATVWPTAANRGKINYVLGSTVYGESDPTYDRTLSDAKDKNFNVRQDAFTSILRIDAASSGHEPAQYYTTSLEEYYANGATTTGKRKPVSYLDFKTDVDGTVTDLLKVDTYYTVRFVMTGNTLLTEVWQSDAKADTYNSIVTAFTDAQMAYAPSGDFGILAANGSSSIDVKNMKIYKGVSHLLSTEDYSEYEDYETAYTFDEDTEALTFKIADSKNQGVSATQSDGKLALFAGEDGNITINNIDSSNTNLGDFIAKWDITDENHNWSTERMSFRKNGSNYWYRLSIVEGGLSLNNTRYDTDKYTYLTLEKKNGANSSIEVLAQYPISAGLMSGVEMTIKVEAIGNTIKVWFGNAGYDMAAPVITYTDTEPLTTGYLEYYHSKDSTNKYTYIDNFYIYDLTAKAIADDVAAVPEDVTCKDLDTYAELISTMAKLNAAQSAKLATTVEKWNKTILPALDHNYSVDEELSTDATYFVAGTQVNKCTACGDTYDTTVTPTEAALKSYDATYADGALTIAWVYNDGLVTDVFNGAQITFNYTIGEYSNNVPVEDDEFGATVILEGFNADRLNADISYNLSAVYGDVDTSKLVNETTKTVVASTLVDDESDLGKLMAAINADGAETTVNGQVEDTATLVSNTISVDIKNATASLRFVASQDLINKLDHLGRVDRTVTLYVTIDGVERQSINIATLQKVTMVNISGLSFEQLNGNITVQLGFVYANDATKKFETDKITFNCGTIIANADTDVAKAFAAYMN